MTRGGTRLAAALLLIAGCGGDPATAPPPRTTPAAVPVSVEAVAARAVVDYAEAVGTVRSRKQTVLSSQIVAVVRGVHVREGDRVRAGQALVELDDRDVRAQLDRARAAVREARGAVAEAERAIEAADRAIEAADAQLALADVTEGRYRALVERQLVAPQAYDEVAARRREARAEAARARELKAALLERRGQAAARVEQTEAEVDNATVVAGHARIAAPAEAIVVSRTVEVGNLAVPGAPLLTLDEERYRLEATVRESEVARLRPGQPVAVAVDAAAGAGALVGPIAEIVPAADPQSRTFTVKIDLPPTPGLRSGVYGRARFATGERTALLVPPSAVTARGQLETVFAVEGGTARLRLVTTGRPHDGRIEILSGLREGDHVVVDGGAGLADGQPVDVRR